QTVKKIMSNRNRDFLACVSQRQARLLLEPLPCTTPKCECPVKSRQLEGRRPTLSSSGRIERGRGEWLLRQRRRSPRSESLSSSSVRRSASETPAHARMSCGTKRARCCPEACPH